MDDEDGSVAASVKQRSPSQKASQLESSDQNELPAAETSERAILPMDGQHSSKRKLEEMEAKDRMEVANHDAGEQRGQVAPEKETPTANGDDSIEEIYSLSSFDSLQSPNRKEAGDGETRLFVQVEEISTNAELQVGVFEDWDAAMAASSEPLSGNESDLWSVHDDDDIEIDNDLEEALLLSDDDAVPVVTKRHPVGGVEETPSLQVDAGQGTETCEREDTVKIETPKVNGNVMLPETAESSPSALVDHDKRSETDLKSKSTTVGKLEQQDVPAIRENTSKVPLVNSATAAMEEQHEVSAPKPESSDAGKDTITVSQHPLTNATSHPMAVANNEEEEGEMEAKSKEEDDRDMIDEESSPAEGVTTPKEDAMDVTVVEGEANEGLDQKEKTEKKEQEKECKGDNSPEETNAIGEKNVDDRTHRSELDVVVENECKSECANSGTLVNDGDPAKVDDRADLEGDVLPAGEEKSKVCSIGEVGDRSTTESHTLQSSHDQSETTEDETVVDEGNNTSPGDIGEHPSEGSEHAGSIFENSDNRLNEVMETDNARTEQKYPDTNTDTVELARPAERSSTPHEEEEMECETSSKDNSSENCTDHDTSREEESSESGTPENCTASDISRGEDVQKQADNSAAPKGIDPEESDEGNSVPIEKNLPEHASTDPIDEEGHLSEQELDVQLSSQSHKSSVDDMEVDSRPASESEMKHDLKEEDYAVREIKINGDLEPVGNNGEESKKCTTHRDEMAEQGTVVREQSIDDNALKQGQCTTESVPKPAMIAVMPQRAADLKEDKMSTSATVHGHQLEDDKDAVHLPRLKALKRKAEECPTVEGEQELNSPQSKCIKLDEEDVYDVIRSEKALHISDEEMCDASPSSNSSPNKEEGKPPDPYDARIAHEQQKSSAGTFKLKPELLGGMDRSPDMAPSSENKSPDRRSSDLDDDNSSSTSSSDSSTSSSDSDSSDDEVQPSSEDTPPVQPVQSMQTNQLIETPEQLVQSNKMDTPVPPTIPEQSDPLVELAKPIETNNDSISDDEHISEQREEQAKITKSEGLKLSISLKRPGQTLMEKASPLRPVDFSNFLSKNNLFNEKSELVKIDYNKPMANCFDSSAPPVPAAPLAAAVNRIKTQSSYSLLNNELKTNYLGVNSADFLLQDESSDTLDEDNRLVIAEKQRRNRKVKPQQPLFEYPALLAPNFMPAGLSDLLPRLAPKGIREKRTLKTTKAMPTMQARKAVAHSIGPGTISVPPAAPIPPPPPPPAPEKKKDKKMVYLCSPCGTYYENWNLFLHMREAHRKHICLYCLGIFPTAERLITHLETKHRVRKRQYASIEDYQQQQLKATAGPFGTMNGAGAAGDKSNTSKSLFLMCSKCEHVFERTDSSDEGDITRHNCADYLEKCTNCGQLKLSKHKCETGKKTVAAKSTIRNTINVNDEKQHMLGPKANSAFNPGGFASKRIGLNDSVDSTNSSTATAVMYNYDNQSNVSNCSSAIGSISNSQSPNNNSLLTKRKAQHSVPLEVPISRTPLCDTFVSPILQSQFLKNVAPEPVTPALPVPPVPQSNEGDMQHEIPNAATGAHMQPHSSPQPPKTPQHHDMMESAVADPPPTDSSESNTEPIANGGEDYNAHDVKPPTPEEVPVTQPEQTTAHAPLLVPKLKVKIPKQYLTPIESEESSTESDYEDDDEGDDEENDEGEEDDAIPKHALTPPANENPFSSPQTAVDDRPVEVSHSPVMEVAPAVTPIMMLPVPAELAKTVSSELQHQPSLLKVEPVFTDKQPLVLKTEQDMAVSAELPPSSPEPDELKIAGEEVPLLQLTLEEPLDRIPIREFIKICLIATVPYCLYCNHARRIAVDGRQLTRHIIENHRFQATVNSITGEELLPQTILQRFLAAMEELQECYFNRETFDCGWTAEQRAAVSFQKEFECFQCRFQTQIHKELYLHNRKMHQKSMLCCLMCRTNFYNYSELLCHMCPGEPNTKTILDYTFRCCICNIDGIPSAFRLMVHLRKRHFACDVCLEECFDQGRLSNHVWKHKLHHLCYRCGISYRNKADIMKHLFWKHGTEGVLCKRCLQKKWPHVYHFCVPPAQFICEVCQAGFSRSVALKVHQRLHSGDAKYPCTEDGCEKRFISRKLLLKHVQRHYEPAEQVLAMGATDTTSPEDNKPVIASNSNSAQVDEGGTEGASVERASCSDDVKPVLDRQATPPPIEASGAPVDGPKIERDTRGTTPVENPGDNVEPSAEQAANETPRKIKKKKKSKDDDKSLVDMMNLPALNLSESDSSDDSDNEHSNGSNNARYQQDNFTSATSADAANLDQCEEKAPMVCDERPETKRDPEDDEEETKDDDSAAGADQIANIWNNFKKYQARATSRKQSTAEEDRGEEELVERMLKNTILHVAQSDHDYCAMYKSLLADAAMEEHEGASERGSSLLKARSNDDTNGSPSKAIQKSPRKRKSSRSGSDSSDSDSSDSDSSCECRSNCSCSSNSSNSSSSSSDGSDSSDENSSKEKRREEYPEKEEEPEVKRPVTPKEEPMVVEPPEEKSEPIDPDDLIFESDLNTEESETDEEFYDEHPQKLANQMLAEKRLQLLAQTCSSPMNSFAIVENSRPSTPSLPPEELAAKKKFKIKKRKRDRKSAKRNTPPMSVTPVANFASHLLGPHSEPTQSRGTPDTPHIPQSTATADAGDDYCWYPMANENSSASCALQAPHLNSGTHTPQIGTPRLSTGNSSESDVPLKRSQRSRKPNKFYGYTSDDEGAAAQFGTPLMKSLNPEKSILSVMKPTPPPNLVWSKEDLPTPPKIPKSVKPSVRPNSTLILVSEQQYPISSAPSTPLNVNVGDFRPGTPGSVKLQPMESTSVGGSIPSSGDDSSDEGEPKHLYVAPPAVVSLTPTLPIQPTTPKPAPSPAPAPVVQQQQPRLPKLKLSLPKKPRASSASKPPIVKRRKTVTPKPRAAPKSAPPIPNSPVHVLPAVPQSAPPFQPPIVETQPKLPPLGSFPSVHSEFFRPSQIRIPAGWRPPREGESVYCYCRCPYDEVSEMIACDGENCRIEWFHFECVGIIMPPKGKWFCPECKLKQPPGTVSAPTADEEEDEEEEDEDDDDEDLSPGMRNQNRHAEDGYVLSGCDTLPGAGGSLLDTNGAMHHRSY